MSAPIPTCAFFLQFGAPGHGKGVWDGIGAWIKRTVRRDIIDNRPPDQKTVKVEESDHILTPKQVAEHVKASFNTEEYVQSHVNKTINEVSTLPAHLTRSRLISCGLYTHRWW